ncbi:hypothetical protein SASPL_137706 [Salvia splendens]|uniref:Myb proto-oncogene protein, plant n=1 Tax=Salvia splendens TaxID=180675 RepID=A0A8X8WVQ1_SALSN|nr:transcription factor MYB14-like [Salvia splendens]KAG6400861.1 hypothetical protein SASPL_137706 [Salvia splendens]
MGRVPCCEKMGLKKGPWTAEEDLVLINFINHNGHANWRALPKLAGLLRCGKSCRLRWMNYLRPDIKRGNFTHEEEAIIIKLHQELGNRWSVIASRLPGRTDNEIKNIWHTHLKKRLSQRSRPEPEARTYANETSSSEESSPMHSSGEVSSENLPEMDESFWSEVFSGDDWSATSDLLSGNSDSSVPLSESVCLDEAESMDFWHNLFSRADDIVELPQF